MAVYAVLRDGAGVREQQLSTDAWRSQHAKWEWEWQWCETWKSMFSSRITEESKTGRCGNERKWSTNLERQQKNRRFHGHSVATGHDI